MWPQMGAKYISTSYYWVYHMTMGLSFQQSSKPSVVPTTVDGQNIQTLQHALCWTPAPPNLNVSARVLAKVMLGVWFFSSIGANALQVTITLNFGGEGVVPDRRGLNISSIYGS